MKLLNFKHRLLGKGENDRRGLGLKNVCFIEEFMYDERIKLEVKQRFMIYRNI